MSLARIVASNPDGARPIARTLREAGYDVEIVPPGTPSNSDVELEFDADTETVISQNVESYVPGQREFVLKPLWRRLTARYHADRDVARARQNPSFAPTAEESNRTAAPSAPERRGEREAREAALAAAEQRKLAEEEARKVEQLRIARERELKEAALQREREAKRAEALRLQRIREEQEAIRLAEMEARQAELRHQEELRREQALARQREYEERQLVLQKQDEERQRTEALRRQRAAETAERQRLAVQQEAFRREAEMQRKAEEAHRQEVFRLRQHEAQSRREEAQRLLITAAQQRDQSARERSETTLLAVEGMATASTAPTLREYLNLRIQDWKLARARKAQVTRIDRSGVFARRQAVPITAGVAAAFLLGWGIAAYHSSSPKAAVQTTPPVLTQSQYAPYPARPTSHPMRTKPTHIRRRAVHDTSIAEDEVITRHYYPKKGATAQNTATPRKKITDLQ